MLFTCCASTNLRAMHIDVLASEDALGDLSLAVIR